MTAANNDLHDAWGELRAATERLSPVVRLLAITFFSMGCGVASLPSATPDSQPSVASEAPAPIDMPVVRQLIIEVSNADDRDAVLLVGQDGPSQEKRKIGNAIPPVVPPRASIRVVFTVPDTADWAIFVNPSPESGAILTAPDLGRCVGFVPIVISVHGSGNSTWSSKARDAPPCMNDT